MPGFFAGRIGSRAGIDRFCVGNIVSSGVVVEVKHKSEGPDSSQLERLERKLDEALYELDFLRRHMSGYLGGGKAITYLADMTPFYVNSNDYGPPANYINGGLYEQENLDVLFSFLRDDTVFLDIGANLGFFAILLARRMPNGAVHAFEPHPQLVELMCASAFLNGLSSMDGHGRINVHRIGIGKTDGNARFTYPEGHLGGGGIGSGRASDIDVQLRSIDSFFGDEFRCDLIKIDVEGHELQALEGMSGVLARSPDVKVLFEKLGTDCGYETEIESLLHGLGMHLFGVTGNGTLSLLQPGALGPFSGYVLAARDLTLDRSTRNAVMIYPRQLFSVAETRVAIDRNAAGRQGCI